MRYSYIALLIALTISHQSYADTPVKYEAIIAALNGGDCKTASELLLKYKKENADKLKQHKDFAKSIEAQLWLCNLMKPGENGEHINTIANQPKPHPGEIRFEMFREKEVNG